MTSETTTDATPQLEVFWRPGCPFCVKLRAVLAMHRVDATWRDIWDDDEARGIVAAANQGNETVPTVRIDGDRTLTNPSWSELAPLIGR